MYCPFGRVCPPLKRQEQNHRGDIELVNKVSSHDDHADAETRFTDMDMAVLSSIGVFAGIVACNVFLHQKVVELTMVYSLTGLAHRLYFNHTFLTVVC